MADAIISALTQASSLSLSDKIELEQGTTPDNHSKYGELGQVYDKLNTERGTVGTLSVVSGVATASLANGRRTFFKMAVGDNFTLAVTDVPSGASFLCIQFTTNATGGYGVGLPASFHAMTGSGASVVTTANAVCYLRAYTVDGGVNWYFIIDAGDAGGGGTTPTQATLSAAILARSPKVYYKCNETSGSTIADSSGNGMDLTLTGTNIIGFGELVDGGNSLFSRSAGGATRGDAAGITLPVNYDWSYVGIVCMENTASGAAFVAMSLGSTGETSASNYQIQIVIAYTTGQMRINMFWERGAGTDVSTGGSLVPGGRPFMLGIRKISATKELDFFIDGKHVYNTTYTNEPDGGSSANLFIATGDTGVTSNHALFVTALSNSDFKAIAQAGGYW